MCGITAVIQLNHDSSRRPRRKTLHEVHASLDKLQHRGPDGRDCWVSNDGRIALGHTRLAIKDLSCSGQQPMTNEDGTVRIVVNGEFYDFEDLRRDLTPTYRFKTACDSELLLALYERDGINCFSSLRGEFAFVLYDSRRQLLLAARDRYGVKPLFWTIANGRLLFASEKKALLAYGWKPQWDTRSIVEDGWLHDSRTLFRGVQKIQPGHYMTCLSFETIQHRPYWEAQYSDKRAKEGRSEREMTLGLRDVLLDAVRSRTQADVPLGVYLSGGLDSAMIAGMLAHVLDLRDDNGEVEKRRNANPPFTCFCVGFEEGTEFDEMPIAQRTADFLGVPLVAQRMDERALAENFEAAAIHFEHHNPDLNSVAKFMLSKLTADHGIKVVLSGEGADEHFGGYSQFCADAVREPDFAVGPDPLSELHRQQLTRQLEKSISPGYKGFSSDVVGPPSQLARRMLNDSSISSSLWTVTVAPFAAWTDNEFGQLRIEDTRAIGAGARALGLVNTQWHPLHTAQYIWTNSILPNFILTSMGDRMEMAHSVEGRPIFLDHRVTEYANGLPPSTKMHLRDAEKGEMTEKWILRKAAISFVTEEVFERRKHAFSAPYAFEEGGPVHRLLSRLLTEENIASLGFVDTEEALRLIDRAFHSHDSTAIRAAFTVAQWVVLSKEFGVPKAQPYVHQRQTFWKSLSIWFREKADEIVNWLIGRRVLLLQGQQQYASVA